MNATPSTVHVISFSTGKDSTALLLLALERCPAGSVLVIFCDTGNEDQAVYDYLDYIEQALDIKIVRLKADFSEEIAAKRAFIAQDVRVGRQYDLLADLIEPTACASAYGLCG